MGDFRDNSIKAPKPYMNPFAMISFHNLRQYNTPTTIIPEEVLEQLDRYSEELRPLHKLLYDIFSNTGLTLKEVFFLEEDCIESSRYPGIFQLKFTPHKVLASRRRHGAGDYHRIMIPQGLADELSEHISATRLTRQTVGSSYIFLSERLGYATTVMDSKPFIKSIQHLIKKHNICGEDGGLWHFTSRQFRKTIAVKLIENGATTAKAATRRTTRAQGHGRSAPGRSWRGGLSRTPSSTQPRACPAFCLPRQIVTTQEGRAPSTSSSPARRARRPSRATSPVRPSPSTARSTSADSSRAAAHTEAAINMREAPLPTTSGTDSSPVRMLLQGFRPRYPQTWTPTSVPPTRQAPTISFGIGWAATPGAKRYILEIRRLVRFAAGCRPASGAATMLRVGT